MAIQEGFIDLRVGSALARNGCDLRSVWPELLADLDASATTSHHAARQAFLGRATASKFFDRSSSTGATSGPRIGDPCPGATHCGFRLARISTDAFAASQSLV